MLCAGARGFADQKSPAFCAFFGFVACNFWQTQLADHAQHHHEDDENYGATLTKLNKAQVDFTKVDLVNKMIKENAFPKEKKRAINFVKPLYYLILLNSIFPILIWKNISKKIDEIEFVDTFRFAVNSIELFGLDAVDIPVLIENKKL